MKSCKIWIALIGVLSLLSCQVVYANAALMTMMIAAVQIQQAQAAEDQKRAAAPAAVAATIHDTLGRAPTSTDIENGLNHLANGGTLEQLRGICATSQEGQTAVSSAVQASTGKTPDQADINNGIQHIMTGGTIQGYTALSQKLGTSAVPNVTAESRQTIWNDSMNGAAQNMPNPASTLGQ
ncbi:MAG: hypothetical protein WA705_27230 [Candidatus Ozemobacteraceae bacterium]